MITFKEAIWNARHVDNLLGGPVSMEDPTRVVINTTRYGRFEYGYRAQFKWITNTKIPWAEVEERLKGLCRHDEGHIVIPLMYNLAVLLKYDGSYENIVTEWKDIPEEILVILHPAVDMTPSTQEARKAPTALAMASTFAQALAHWAAAGFSIVTEASYKARYEICLKCPEWLDEGYFKVGKCKVCGCSGAKLYMTTSECPLKKW